MTLREAVAWGADVLRAESQLAVHAVWDAELLLAHELSLSRTELRAYPERLLPVDRLKPFQRMVSRRLGFEPIQYIIGEQEFYGLRLRVTPAVLIPRPETELLVEQVLLAVPADRPVRMLDLGTGSGAIAIALAKHLPGATLVAVDLSPGAVAVAAGNAEVHGVASRIRFAESDLLSAISEEQFDAIVSNPPYVPVVDRTSLHPEVREHEPGLALFAGETGMDLYRRLVPEAAAALKPGGLLAMEIGFGQREAIATLLAQWSDVTFHEDLQGIARVVMARWHGLTKLLED